MTHYIRNGNTVRVASDAAMNLTQTLATGVYVVKCDEMTGVYYLEDSKTFSIPSKRYGSIDRYTHRILTTFHSREASTGVLLVGEKGSGKTLLAKMLSATSGMPTILVNESFRGSTFNAFIQSIEQDAVVLFDEFEKVYDIDDQEAMLTLLDGTTPSKKLYVLTCNDVCSVNEHMRNRPGRLFYNIAFKGLEIDFVREYCIDHLKNSDHIQGVVDSLVLFSRFNFDMLQALVEEMNRYGESAIEALELINAKVDQDIHRNTMSA